MPTFLPGGEPFFSSGNRVGCLLVHGFTGTPYEMRGLGDFLHDEFGYTVSGPALAGHATRVEDLARTTWQDWSGSVHTAYTELAARCDQVFAIGLSLGAMLVLHLAAREEGMPQDSPLRGVVAISGPAYYRHRLIPLFRLLPFLHRVIPHWPKRAADDDTQDPTVRAHHPQYESSPTRAARSLIDGLGQMRAELARIQIPALLLQGLDDRTIPSDSMPLIYSELGSHDKRMFWLERSGHLVLEDYAHERAFQLIGEFIDQHVQGREIISSEVATWLQQNP